MGCFSMRPGDRRHANERPWFRRMPADLEATVICSACKGALHPVIRLPATRASRSATQRTNRVAFACHLELCITRSGSSPPSHHLEDD